MNSPKIGKIRKDQPTGYPKKQGRISFKTGTVLSLVLHQEGKGLWKRGIETFGKVSRDFRQDVKRLFGEKHLADTKSIKGGQS